MDDANPYRPTTETQAGSDLVTADCANTLSRSEERILTTAVRASKERWLDMGIVVPAIILFGVTAYHYYYGHDFAVSAGTTIGDILVDDAGGFRGDAFRGDYVRAIDKLMTGTLVLLVATAMIW